MKQEPVVELFRDRRGKWFWRFVAPVVKDGTLVWDILAKGTNSHDSYQDAEEDARFVICRGWIVKTDYPVPESYWRKLVNFFTR